MGQIASKICGSEERAAELAGKRTIKPALPSLDTETASNGDRSGSTSKDLPQMTPPTAAATPVKTFGAKLADEESTKAATEEEEEVTQRTDPITLDLLQGDWFNSVGAKVHVSGTEVSLNGILMAAHPVITYDDGTVDRIGTIWQCWGWSKDNKIEFKEAPTREAAVYARSVTWSPANTAAQKEKWENHMVNLGYAGSALGDLSKRGIEGCRPGSCDAFKGNPEDKSKDPEEEVKELTELIQKWREPSLCDVLPRKVFPDYSNRCHTGISVEHMHYLAKSMVDKGFQKRNNLTHYGHDMPVVVRESPRTELGKLSYENWIDKVEGDDGFPPSEFYKKTFREPTFFTSLGNGHFFQALNMIYNHCPVINEMNLRTGKREYTSDHDDLLMEALNEGVPSLVLKTETPLKDRQTISRLLNSKREFRWIMSAGGEFLGIEEDTSQVSQFVAMSKVLDAVELNCLVRAELGVTESGRIGK